MPVLDGKDQEENSPKQAGSCWFARSLTAHKWRELVSSGCLVCRCHHVFLWCYLCFVLLRFRLHAFIEVAALLRSIVLRYAGAPIATNTCFFLFPLIYSEMSLFLSIFCIESTSYVFSFLSDGSFLSCHHGLFLFTSAYVRNQFIKSTRITFC